MSVVVLNPAERDLHTIVHAIRQLAEGRSNKTAFRVHKNGTDQTGVADVTATAVTFSTEAYDVGNYFASNAWTPPPGKVTMTAVITATALVAIGALVAVIIQKDGVDFAQGNATTSLNLGAAMVTVEDDANGSNVYTVNFYIDITSGTATISGTAKQTYFCGHVSG